MAPTQALLRAIKNGQEYKIMDLSTTCDNNRKYMAQLDNYNLWRDLSRQCYSRLDFMRIFNNKLDWKIISQNTLDIVTGVKFKNYLIWSEVSKQRYLSSNFILTFGDLLDMEIICKNYKNLSVDVQKKFASKLKWNKVIATHFIKEEWFKEPTVIILTTISFTKLKHLGAIIKNPEYMDKINLELYMQEPNRISDSLIIYCLQEGRVGELRNIASSINWSEHMIVFDKYPGFVGTLYDDWKCIEKWSSSNAPSLYYIRHMFNVPQFKEEFYKDFVKTDYWCRLLQYTVTSYHEPSIVFNLMVFHNYSSYTDWHVLQQSDSFEKIEVLSTLPYVSYDITTIGSGSIDDNRIWKKYSIYLKGSDYWTDKEPTEIASPVIPLNMTVREAYEKMRLIEPCASREEHETANKCNCIFKTNQDKEHLLNWELMSANQPVCPFNKQHLLNINAYTYRTKNSLLQRRNLQEYGDASNEYMNVNCFLINI
ncbi:hypothetical protein [Lonomia obliqua multiple nucleopolyhedrovirus]|uniref:Uncharacterized protein n=1 Tax=Lonomia obliqua multiple nucleopolyhedrovirus TaxID=134394 RepID=A0A126FC75_9ABAC|nr:hypothetical protein [Lonomia obliqua multiple nucleopolyhedrovirus]AKN81006.1 hypothetical protein [Lonomia obliqua multiple nucleopolyhedrovirus]